MKRLLMMTALTSALALGAGITQAQETPDIVVITHGQGVDGFWARVRNGVNDAAETTGANVTYRAPETFNMVEMAALIDAAVTQEPDGLVVSIPDADALGPSIERAVEAGIPVISINSGGDVSADLGALLHVGMDEYAAGRAAGERLAAEGGTNGLCINNEVGNVALDQRCQGFEDGFAGTSSVLPSTSDLAETEARVSAALLSDESIDTILATSSQFGGIPAIAAVRANDMLDEVNVATFDLTPDFLEFVEAGEALFAIDQQQYLQGYLPVVFLALHAEYGLIPFGDVASGPNLITQATASMTVELSEIEIR